MSGTMKQWVWISPMEGTGETSGSFWFDAASSMLIEEVNLTAIEIDTGHYRAAADDNSHVAEKLAPVKH